MEQEIGRVAGRLAVWLMAAVVAIGVLIAPVSAAAAPPSTVPDEGVAAPIACPNVGSLASTDRNVRLNDQGGSLECTYTPGYRITVNWVDIGQPGGSNCSVRLGDTDGASETSGNSLYSVTAGNASVGASVDLRKEDRPASREEFVAAAQQLIAGFEPVSEPCAPTYICAPTIGAVPYDDFFGNEDRSGDTIARNGTWTIDCQYQVDYDALDEGDEVVDSEVRISVTYATSSATETSKITPCATVDGFAGGITIVDGPGTSALFGKIDAVSPHLAYDIDAARAELDAMIAVFAPDAVDCAGVPEPDIYSPLPPWLADVWNPAYATGQPTLLLTPGSAEQLITIPEAASTDLDESPATTVPAVESTPAPPPSDAQQPSAAVVTTTTTISTTISSNTTLSTTISGNIAANAFDEPPSSASSSGGWTPPGWLRVLLRVFSVIALPLSILGIAIALLTLRKESRVRPKLDAIRIMIMATVGLVTTLVLGRSTPVWVFAVAIVVGVSLGLVQGRNLEVRVANDRLMAQRSRWAIVAFLVGLVCAQLSGMLGRVGVLSIGIGLTMLSAALTAGISFGRRPKIRAARAAVATSLLFVFVAAPITALVAGDAGRDAPVASAQEDDSEDSGDNVDEPEPQPEPVAAETVSDQLAAMVDWDNVQLVSGYGVDNGKPPVELALPIGLATVPEPQTFATSWSREWAGDTETYNLDETYSFALTADDVCCSVSYTASGTEQRGDRPAEAITAAADLGGMVSIDPNAFRAEPFGRQEILDDGSCGRQFVRTGPVDEVEPTFSTLIVGADDSSGNASPELNAYAPCELPGFTTTAALEQAPDVPPIGDPQRVNFGESPCPVFQEVYGVFADDDRFAGQADTSDLIDLFRKPNQPSCQGAAYAGDEKPGGLRNEFQFSFASLDPNAEASRQRQITETFGDRTYQHEIPPERRCTVAEDGLPQNGADQDFCLHRTFHEFGDGQVTIWTNTDLADGPDTTVRGNFPWGSYFFNCHHCDVGDPYIAQVLNQWHQFAHDWNATGLAPPASADEEFAEPSADGAETAEEPEEDSEQGETNENQADNVGDDAEADNAENELTDEEPTGSESTDEGSGDDDIGAEEAAAIALVSLLGAAGIAGTTIAESGHSASELLDTYRNGGLDGLGDLLDRDLTDLEGTLADNSDPPESPNDRVRGWDPNREEFRDMSRAQRDRLDGVDRSQRREERLERDAELLADIREDRARVDRETDRLERRDELEAQLADAEAAQDRWSNPDYVNQVIADDAFDGMLRDIEGLPGELRDVAQAVNETLNDPETWEVLEDTLGGTAYDLAGMLSPVEFGDGRQHLTDSTRGLGRFGLAMAEAFRQDPVGFVVQMSPLQDVKDSLDGDHTLGQRLASLGAVLSELFPAMGGASLARDASNLADASRDLERAADAARSRQRLGDLRRDADRASELAGGARDFDRAGELAGSGTEAQQALDRFTDAQRRTALTESVDDIAHTAQGVPRGPGGVVDDIEAQIARNRANLSDALGSPEDQLRREAWESNQRVGAAAVDDFAHHATRPIDLDVESVGEISAAQREAALRVQTNKNALQQIKNQPEAVQRTFVNQMREVYDETDAEVLDWATEYINKQDAGRLGGVQIQGDLVYDRIEDGRHVFVDDLGTEIQLFEPTNAKPGQVSVGADRDFTAYVRPAGSKDPAFSLPRDEVRPVYNDALYDAIGGDEMRERLGIPAVTPEEVIADAQRRGIDPPGDPVEAARRQTVDRVAERLDQAVTDDLDPEAYKNVRTVINRPFSEIGDSQQVGLTVTHKGEEWAWRADHSGDRAMRPTGSGGDAGGGISWSQLSEDQRAEGVRQIVKQNGKQVQPRLEALQRQTEYLKSQGLLPPKTPIPKPDTRLDQAMAIMETIGKDGVSPVDMERRLLAETGMTPSHVANATGERIRLMEQLRPPEVRDLQQRMDRIADQLKVELKDLPDPSKRIPTSDQVWERLILEDRKLPGGSS